jgi:hypothetical protein
MSKRVFLFGVGIALLGLGLAFTDRVLSLRPGVTEANYKRLRVGMTMAEVAAILGQPEPRQPQVNSNGVRIEGGLHVWRGQDGAYVLTFGRKRVGCIAWQGPTRSSPGLLARLRSWLGW